MPRPKTNLLLCLSVFLFLGIVSSVRAAETMTIDTYYPSPYGVYKTMRLYPTDDINPNDSCVNKGEIYFDNSDNSLYYCDGTNWTGVGTKSGLPQQQIFRNNGTFVVPPGIRKLKIKLWGAGGGGGRGSYPSMALRVDGTNGGNTSFGSFIAYGGDGGVGGTNAGHGAGGVGGGYSLGVNIGYTGGNGGNADMGLGKNYGGSPGFGGRTSICCDGSVSDPGGGGWGGGREDSSEVGGAGGGGGGGGYVEHIFDVTPGTNYAVIVEAGGIGGGIGVPPISYCGGTPCNPGKDGTKGMVIVEW